MDKKLLNKHGLTSEKATKLLKKYGPNRISTGGRSVLLLIVHQFFNPMFLLLFVAAVVSYLGGSYSEVSIILFIILVNSGISFAQELKAWQTFRSLSRLVSPSVKVWRDGDIKEIEVKKVVPGDVLLLEPGSLIPADSFVISAKNAICEASPFEGRKMYEEKVENPKEDKEFHDGVVYAGSYLQSGSMLVKAFATGSSTKISRNMSLKEPEEHLSEYERNLRKLTRDLMLITIVSVGLIFVLFNIFKPSGDIYGVLLFSLALSITVIPEALPAIATITLSVSASRLAAKGAVIRKLSAIESLGNIDLICTDKTGTLTENKLSVIKTEVNPLFKDEFLKYCHLSSALSSDPFDIALQEMLEVRNFDNYPLTMKFEDEAFDPFKKYSSREFPGFKIIKGAPETLMQHSRVPQKTLRKMEEEIRKGYRVLGIALVSQARTDYLGTVYFYDPVKPGVKNALELAEKQGIELKIITGDSYGVSRYVSREVGITKDEEEIIAADELHYEDPLLLEQQVQKYKVFCRADPIQKYKIIEALQKNFSVAYLGDGINDAPSLKLADVGIVVNNATDIAKASSDLILLNKDLHVLVSAVVEGRTSFDNIEKFLLHTLSSNFGNFLALAFFSFFLAYLPMLPLQILIMNLIVSLTALSLTVDKVERPAIKKPLHRDFENVLRYSLLLGAMSFVLDIVFFALVGSNPPQEVQTMWFVTSGLAEILLFFSLRTRKPFYKSSPRLAMLAISILSGFIIVIFGILGVRGVFTGTIELKTIPMLLLFAVAYLVFTDLLKLRAAKYFKV